MAWLVPFSSLTPAQQDAVQMETRSHKAIVGGPGAGKTLVLLHRLDLLFNRAGRRPDAVRLFVYTNTLKEFIRAGIDVLDFPQDCILTFDKWCADVYRQYVGRTLPRVDGKPDFDAVRAEVSHLVESGRLKTPLYDHVLVDEAQDLDTSAVEVLKRIARHITVCMDSKQQLYEGRVTETDLLSQLGLSRHNVALLAAYRCNPMVTELAAQFVSDEERRLEFIRQAANPDMDRSRPLLYVAASFDDEVAHLIEMVKLRLMYGDSIAILFPMQRQVHGFAKGFAAAGIDVEIQDRNGTIDCASHLPKLMTYHQAKGMTFDCVLLPRLGRGSFPGRLEERIEHLLFVGASRAIKWVHLSGVNGTLIPALLDLARRDSKGFLEITLGADAAGLLQPDITTAVPNVAVGDEFGLN